MQAGEAIAFSLAFSLALSLSLSPLSLVRTGSLFLSPWISLFLSPV